ncbi:MAG: MFS transporter [Candidatus Hydrogenedentes bacterium]|nr:MFS transporter [Candidatus Hydrogenedentota bacterium]
MSSNTPDANPQPLSPAARRALGVVFATLFIDLIGFSIIFPLFPGMLTYYRDVSDGSGLFGVLYHVVEGLNRLSGSPEGDWGIIVLFGGTLGGLYSLLQFLCAPYWGSLSDRWGRKPVLLLTMSGMLLSYVLWFFSGNFTLLVVSRLIGGIMSGNISTATAIVADVTDARNRGKGMAIIGIAFGFGFVVGPALGGMASVIDLTEHWPALAKIGINPYSMPAAIALLLTALNLVQVSLRLQETRPATAGDGPHTQRTANVFALFRAEFPGVRRTNLAYFLFLLAFSGMEFSLTFLAVERFGFSDQQNGYMFLFVGILLALVQGSYVQRFSGRIGNKRMSLQGLAMIIPGLLIVGLAGHWQMLWPFFIGLALLAAGAAQATPCLTALASVYAPAEAQGRVLGTFRSLGALARALGPLIACVLYWRLGPTAAYFIGGIFVFVPMAVTTTLPQPAEG